MKILMLTPYLPYPPASGGQIRTLYLLKYLGKNNDITLVSLYKDEVEKKYESELHTYCKKIYLCKRPQKPWQIGNILKAIFSAQPFLVIRNYSSEAKQVVKKLLNENNFDVIHAETFYIMPHIPETDTPILLVEQTIEFKVYQHFLSSLPFWISIPLSLDIFKLKYWEKFYWKKANLVATVSDADRLEIKKNTPKLEPVVIPNGAGDEMFIDRFNSPDINNPELLFVGNFYWLQNVEAANYLIDKIFPLVTKIIPNVKLKICGQNSLKITNRNIENITIINLLPDDGTKVKMLYRFATLFIAPIFGPGGTRLKILASMASGLPVISTKTGIEGLDVHNEKHILTAQKPNEFVSQIQKILKDQVLYKTIQTNAYELAKKNYSWETIAKKLEAVYNEILHD